MAWKVAGFMIEYVMAASRRERTNEGQNGSCPSPEPKSVPVPAMALCWAVPRCVLFMAGFTESSVL